MTDQDRRAGQRPRTMPCVVLAVALLAILAADASAVPPLDQPRWLRLDTAHFTILSARDETASWQLGADLERLHTVLAQLFPDLDFASPAPTTFYVFPSQERFLDYLPLSSDPDQTRGVFLPGPHRHHAALDGHPGSDPSRTVFRHYLHDLIGKNLPQVPLWFRQGLAEYYSSFTIDGDMAKIGQPIAGYLTWLGQGFTARIPLARLLTMAGEPTDPGERTVFVQQSWATVHYLLSDFGPRRQATVRFVALLGEGTQPPQAFVEAFAQSPAAMDEALDDYVTRTSFNVLKVPITERPQLAARVRPLDRHELLAHLGDLLFHAGRDADARGHYQAALLADADHGPAHLGLGLLAQRAGDVEASRDAFTRAAELLPDDPAALLPYGKHLVASLGRKRPQDEEQAERLRRGIDALERVVTAWPTVGEAWTELGFAYNLTVEPTARGAEALETAAALLDDRSDVLFNLLMAYARLGRIDDAQRVEDRLVARGADATTRVRAREVLLQMAYREANHLARSEAFDDALALFARVRAETTDEALRTRADERIGTFASAARHNQFAAQYQAAYTAFRDGQHDLARSLAHAIESDAWPGQQQEAIRRLLAALEAGG